MDTQQLQAAEELANRRSKEIDMLKDELKFANEKIDQLAKKNKDLYNKSTEYEAELMPEKLKVKRLEGEVGIVNQYNAHLKSEMERLQKETIENRNASGEKLLKLENELSQVKSEMLEKEFAITTAQALKETLSKQVAELNEKVSSLTEVNAYSEREIVSMKRMIEMLRQAEDKQANEKVEALSMVAEMKKAMDVFKQECVSDQDQLMSDKLELQAKVAELVAELNAFRQEREKRNQMSSLFPISSLSNEEKLKSEGMTLTSLYHSLVVEREENRKNKHDLDLVKSHFDALISEVEDKAVTFAKLRMEYEQVINSHEEMMDRLASCIRGEREKEEEVRRANEREKELRGELETVKQDCADLASQVQHLLRAEAKKVVSSPPREDLNASDVITENLITFSSLKELQEKNLQLIRIIRKLSEEREKEEKEEGGGNEEMQIALAELQELKEKRKREEELIKSLVAQRDMYRVLLSQSTSTPSPAAPEKDFESRVKEEKEKFANEIMKQVNDLNKLNEGLKEEAFKQRLAASKASSEADYSANRVKEFESLVHSQKVEMERMRKACDELQSQCFALQEISERKSGELKAAVTAVAEKAAQVKSLEASKELLERELEEVKERMKEVRRLNEKLSGVNDQYEASLALAMRDKEEFKRMLEKAQESSALERENSSGVSSEKVLVEELREENKALKIVQATLKAENENFLKTEKMLKEHLDHSNRMLSTANEAKATSSFSFSSAEMDSLRKEIEALKAQLSVKSADAEAYRAISQTNEDVLKKLSEASEKFKRENEENLKICMEERNGLAMELEKKEVEVNKWRSELSKLERGEAEKKELEEKLAALQIQHGALQKDLKLHMDQASEMGNNYNRMLQLHASDSNALVQLRKKVEEREREEREKEEKLAEAKANGERWLKEKESLEKRIKEIEEETLIELRKENQLLLQQVERQANSHFYSNVDEEKKIRELIAISTRQRDRLVLEKEQLAMDNKKLSHQLNLLRKEKAAESTSAPSSSSLSLEDSQKLIAAVQENSILRQMNAAMAEDQKNLKKQLEETNGALDERATLFEERKKELMQKEAELASLREELNSRGYEIKLLQKSYEEITERLGDVGLKEEVRKLQRELQETKEREKTALVEPLKEIDALKRAVGELELQKAGEEEKVKKIRENAMKFKEARDKLKLELEEERKKVEEEAKAKAGELSQVKEELEKLQMIEKERLNKYRSHIKKLQTSAVESLFAEWEKQDIVEASRALDIPFDPSDLSEERRSELKAMVKSKMERIQRAFAKKEEGGDKEEEEKKQDEELLKKKQQEEELLKKKHDEELLKKKQDEELLKKKQEEELLKKKQEEELKKKQQEEELKKNQQEDESKTTQQEEEGEKKEVPQPATDKTPLVTRKKARIVLVDDEEKDDAKKQLRLGEKKAKLLERIEEEKSKMAGSESAESKKEERQRKIQLRLAKELEEKKQE